MVQLRGSFTQTGNGTCPSKVEGTDKILCTMLVGNGQWFW